jgi:hypothetical protein
LSSANEAPRLPWSGQASRDGLQRLLFSSQNSSLGLEFLEAVVQNASMIASQLIGIESRHEHSCIIEQERLVMCSRSRRAWQEAVTSGPNIESIKQDRQMNLIGRRLTNQSWISTLSRDMMMYDKHGPLDLILYDDNHEEIRKWARNRIREMKAREMEVRLSNWCHSPTEPRLKDVLMPNELAALASRLSQLTNIGQASRGSNRHPESGITPRIALLSVGQLTNDLSEAIVRCCSPQNFLSTSLFMFWACDEIQRFPLLWRGNVRAELSSIGKALLRHYVACAIAVCKMPLTIPASF